MRFSSTEIAHSGSEYLASFKESYHTAHATHGLHDVEYDVRLIELVRERDIELRSHT